MSSTEKSPPDDRSRDPIRLALTFGVLIVLSIVSYWDVWTFDFIDYDDNVYVFKNPNVLRGLSFEGLTENLTSMEGANWQPLIWFSFQLEIDLFGLNPHAMHADNLALHTVNGLLLFLALLRMTGHLSRSGIVAALFLVHPMHVESVAWITERKDVLSTFFLLLSIHAYRSYVARPGSARMGLVAATMGLGLMAKSMLVTLPCVFLLLDYWPLCRVSFASSSILQPWRPLVIEKATLFALTAVACMLTLAAQGRAGATSSIASLPMEKRLQNACEAYVFYLQKTLIPLDLAAFYPQHPGNSLILECLILIAITIASVWQIHGRPYMAVGWFWFLGTLVPVIGLVQVGAQLCANRYTYVPHIGLFIALVWTMEELASPKRWSRMVFHSAVFFLVIASVIQTRAQLIYWSDTRLLWEHTLAIDQENWMANFQLGIIYREEKKFEESKRLLNQAYRLRPDEPWTNFYIGLIRMSEGETAVAAKHFEIATRREPPLWEAFADLALTQMMMGQAQEAVRNMTRAVELNPKSASNHFNLAQMYEAVNNPVAARKHYQQVLVLKPDDSDADEALRRLAK